METHLQTGSLIQVLQKLYSRLAQFAFYTLKGFGKHRTARHHNGDIASPLHDYIDLLASKAPSGGEAGKNKPAMHPVTGPEDRISYQGDNGVVETTGGDKVRALVKHYEGRKSATLLVPGIGEKLGNSVWEHLHEAIRFGRMGDINNARLHTDLANGTLKEAVQYMSREDFAELIEQIDKKFDDVLNR